MNNLTKMINVMMINAMITLCVAELAVYTTTNTNTEIYKNPIPEYNPKNLRGSAPVHHNNLRRLGATPSAKNIEVKCFNATSNCGINGQCRNTKDGFMCACDSGYYSMEENNPCAVKGESQTVMAVIWYLFGWTGASAFVLGWTSLGVSTLLTCCGGCWGIGISKAKEGYSDTKRACAFCIGFCSYLALFVLWIYVAVMISSPSTCVNDKGVPCDKW